MAPVVLKCKTCGGFKPCKDYSSSERQKNRKKRQCKECKPPKKMQTVAAAAAPALDAASTGGDGRSDGALDAAITIGDGESVERTRAPKRPRLNTSLSAQASVWNTPEAMSRRRTIATLLQNAYVNTDSLHASIVSLLAPLVQEWIFTVKLHMPGKKKDKMWLEMMERIRTCCVFEVRNLL